MASPEELGNDDITPYLNDNQQNLLLAALNAQAKTRQSLQNSSAPSADTGLTQRATSAEAQQPTTMSESTMFMSPHDAELDNLDYTPDLDYLDGDDSFDFDNADLGGEMIGALPGDGDLHDKRKMSDDQDGSDEADPKRQEGEKGAKKPGRKPLTSEPTTKRKAQNRAAQRAFRERKEKHLKDLETKVADLAKTHEADKHEKGLLKAQVDRLRVELREYRKRLSLGAGSGASRGSPPLAAYTGPGRSNSGSSINNSNNNNFQFDFPKFGALPGSQMFNTQQSVSNGVSNGVLQRGSITPPPARQSPASNGLGSLPNQPPAQVQRANSQGSQVGQSRSSRNITPAANTSNGNTPPAFNDSTMPSVGFSTTQNMHGFASTLPQMNSDNPFGDLFSPSLLKNANFSANNGYFDGTKQTASSHNSFDASNGGESTAGLNRVFQFNGGSTASDSASPSNSSSTQWNANANSSCGTSPEPSHDSPATNGHNSIDSYSQEKPSTYTNAQFSQALSAQEMSANPNIGLTDTNLNYWAPSTGINDPVLFGEYRDNNEPSFGFFDDALNTAPFDYGSPSNLFGILQSPQQMPTTLNTQPSMPANAAKPSNALMAQMDAAREGGDDDYGLPNTAMQARPATDQKPDKLISCNNIWNQLQSNAEFQAGTFDLDSLCSELRAKARCSESGVMVSQDHVDAALKKLGKKDEQGKFVPATATDVPPLMFEQESWDKVLQRLGGGGAA
ncbi:DNA-binding transcription factor yap1 [Recurvomyces mirabilis]|nr:DNA-binding transcription factor yap1 [Recurvomyces mirabilis]